jgi:hypothetical protein
MVDSITVGEVLEAAHELLETTSRDGLVSATV